ncbi:MAG: HAMP domain-containing histidine kinase [Planctomycetales bacterium]|nr:HAMP domain-containing histidine kinase [Planctomycetales bacterium]
MIPDANFDSIIEFYARYYPDILLSLLERRMRGSLRVLLPLGAVQDWSLILTNSTRCETPATDESPQFAIRFSASPNTSPEALTPRECEDLSDWLESADPSSKSTVVLSASETPVPAALQPAFAGSPPRSFDTNSFQIVTKMSTSREHCRCKAILVAWQDPDANWALEVRDRLADALEFAFQIALHDAVETRIAQQVSSWTISRFREHLPLAARVFVHMLNNRFSGISGNVFFLNSVLGNDDEVKKGIDNMTDAVSVITELNRAVAAAILRSDGPLQRFAVREALLEACELCLIFTGAAVEFRADMLATDPIRANGSRSSFVYSVLNLLVNAHQAQGATDQRPLELELVRCDNELATRRGLRRPNEIAYFCVTVKDHGKGFSKEAKQHALELGFTTQPNSQGAGLSVADEVVRSMQGRILLQPVEPSAEWGGVVEIILPEWTEDEPSVSV